MLGRGPQTGSIFSASSLFYPPPFTALLGCKLCSSTVHLLSYLCSHCASTRFIICKFAGQRGPARQRRGGERARRTAAVHGHGQGCLRLPSLADRILGHYCFQRNIASFFAGRESAVGSRPSKFRAAWAILGADLTSAVARRVVGARVRARGAPPGRAAGPLYCRSLPPRIPSLSGSSAEQAGAHPAVTAAPCRRAPASPRPPLDASAGP